MGILDLIKQGQDLPAHPAYEELRKLWAFLELSFRGGSKYKNGHDADGQEIFVPHELESKKGIERRKRLATYRNYCRPIAQKYSSFIFGYPVTRDPDNAALTEWAKDVDARGRTLPEFMATASLKAEILGRWFVLVDTTKGPETQTQAQAKAAGNRAFVSSIHPSRVRHWAHASEVEQLTEVLVLDEPNSLARLYTAFDFTVIHLKPGTLEVVTIEPPVPHSYERPQVVMVTALNGAESLIGDIAEVNKAIFNMDGVLREEIHRQTFTQFFASGLNAKDLKPLSLGGRKIICHKSKDAKIDRLTADVGQAASIRDTIKDDIAEIYRLAGLQTPDVVQNTESGRALKIRWNEIALVAAQIADHAERAENEILGLWAKATNAPAPAPSDYPEEFDAEDLAVELKASLDLLDSDMPWLLKEQQILAYAGRKFPKLTAEQKNELQKQLDELEATEVERRAISKQLALAGAQAADKANAQDGDEPPAPPPTPGE